MELRFRLHTSSSVTDIPSLKHILEVNIKKTMPKRICVTNYAQFCFFAISLNRNFEYGFREVVYLWFFIVSIIICYKCIWHFKSLYFCTIKVISKWHINLIRRINDCLANIGEHFGFWGLSWYVNFLKTNLIEFVILKKYTSRSKFCISLIIGSCDMEIPIFRFLVFFGGSHFENTPGEGVHTKILTPTLHIHIIWALSIQKDIGWFAIGMNKGTPWLFIIDLIISPKPFHISTWYMCR